MKKYFRAFTRGPYVDIWLARDEWEVQKSGKEKLLGTRYGRMKGRYANFFEGRLYAEMENISEVPPTLQLEPDVARGLYLTLKRYFEDEDARKD